jgi:hypothetical protein
LSSLGHAIPTTALKFTLELFVILPTNPAME